MTNPTRPRPVLLRSLTTASRFAAHPHACREMNRRSFLGGSATFTAWSMLPMRSALAGTSDPRLLVIILRGALDGLATVMPMGDPQFAIHRAAFLDDMALAGDPLPLDGFFALSPHLRALHRLYGKGEAMILHAVASPYRDRSHFDGQDVLETGLPGVGSVESGWLNRLLGSVRPSGAQAKAEGLFVGASVPLIMRGAQPTVSYAPDARNAIFDDTQARLLALYQDTDPALAVAWAEGLNLEAISFAGDDLIADQNALEKPALDKGPARAVEEMVRAASLLADDAGPRIAAISIDGWDTHAQQGPGTGLLADRLKILDGFVDGLTRVLKPVWNDTSIVIVTEFGRTVAVNGTHGTDHGTGTSALLIGGAVAGGRVHADWPGLRNSELFEGRDLRPTTDLRSIFKGLIAPRFDVSGRALDDEIFPESAAVRAMEGLYRSA